MIKFLKIKNSHFNMKQKILFSYIFLILLPSCLMMYFYYKNTSGIIEKEVTNSILQSLNQTQINISYKLNTIETVSNMLFMKQDLYKILGRNDEQLSIAQEIDDSKEMRKIIEEAQNANDIQKIRMFISEKKLYSGQLDNFFPLNMIQNEDWYKKVVSSNGRIFWRTTCLEKYIGSDYQYVISCMRMLRHPDKYDKLMAILSIDMPEKTLYDIISEVKVTSRQNIFIIDNNGLIISHRDKNQLGKLYKYSNNNDGQEGVFKATDIEDRNEVYIIYKSINQTNWKIVAEIPVSEINKSINVFSKVSGVIGIVALLILFMLALVLFAAFLAEGVDKRIRSMIHVMEAQGIDRAEVYTSREGDIYQLEKSIDKMANTIKRLTEESFQAQLHERDARLKALQAQINPHFLYNTLDMINWMAIRKKATEISEMIDALAKYFRYSLSKGQDIVTIWDEIQLAQIYLLIQKKRLGDTFSVDMDIDDSVKQYKIPKLLLQPIIENAILHGIQERNDKEGKISIYVKMLKEEILIQVIDNGVGIDSEKLKLLLRAELQESYGLYNINERIRLLFGDEYGVNIISEPGKGTEVSLKIKAVRELKIIP